MEHVSYHFLLHVSDLFSVFTLLGALIGALTYGLLGSHLSSLTKPKICFQHKQYVHVFPTAFRTFQFVKHVKLFIIKTCLSMTLSESTRSWTYSTL